METVRLPHFQQKQRLNWPSCLVIVRCHSLASYFGYNQGPWAFELDSKEANENQFTDYFHKELSSQRSQQLTFIMFLRDI